MNCRHRTNDVEDLSDFHAHISLGVLEPNTGAFRVGPFVTYTAAKLCAIIAVGAE